MGAHLNKMFQAAVMREVLCKLELDELTVTKIPVSVCHGQGEIAHISHSTY